jgi:pilus assembly protein Flp/PilA
VNVGTGSGHELPNIYKREGNPTMNLLKRLWKDEEGQDLVEYALLVVLLALAATVGMNGLATAINNTFIAAGTNLTTNT